MINKHFQNNPRVIPIVISSINIYARQTKNARLTYRWFRTDSKTYLIDITIQAHSSPASTKFLYRKIPPEKEQHLSLIRYHSVSYKIANETNLLFHYRTFPTTQIGSNICAIEWLLELQTVTWWHNFGFADILGDLLSQPCVDSYLLS